MGAYVRLLPMCQVTASRHTGVKMIWVFATVSLLSLVLRETNAQASALYTCVPQALCPNGVPNNPTIDPRIVTPGGGGTGGGGTGYLCPIGLVACYGQGAQGQCGYTAVSPINTNPGTAQQGAHPWQAYMTVNNAYIGSGVLLNNYHVLTAAHKVVPYGVNPGSIRVYFGVYNPTNLAGTQNSTVQKVVPASDYNATTLRNDIAILKLTNPIGIGVQNTINTACLPNATNSFVGQTCLVAGWGQSSFATNDAPTNPMKQVAVPIVPISTCYTSFSNASLLGTNVNLYLDQAGEICAGGQAMQDACTQDGGAPLVCLVNQRFTIAGLVIWGKNCGLSNVYGVYVNVPAYKARIDAAIQALNTNIDGISVL